MIIPKKVLPDVIKDLCEDISKAANVPFEIPASYCLGLLATSIGGGLVGEYRGRHLYPNIYVLVVANSGTGKSAAYGYPSNVIFRCQSELREMRKKDKAKAMSSYKLAKSRMNGILAEAKKGPVVGGQSVKCESP